MPKFVMPAPPKVTMRLRSMPAGVIGTLFDVASVN
jgi:hypothetical protein